MSMVGTVINGNVHTETLCADTFYMSWYNGVQDESVENRVVYATSTDGEHWTQPLEIFPPLGPIGNENEPWFLVDNRLYAVASSWDVLRRSGAGAEHDGPQVPMVRQVFGPSDVGTDIFWLADAAPKGYEWCGFKVYTAMSETVVKDMTELMHLLVNDTLPKDDGEPNERSMYALPGSLNTLVQLLRAGDKSYPARLLSSVCTVEGTDVAKDTGTAGEVDMIQCRTGTGIFMFNFAGKQTTGFDYRSCDWSDAAITTMPDSKARTCTSHLPDGRIYLVGNQLEKYRDPVTIALSTNGIEFTKVRIFFHYFVYKSAICHALVDTNLVSIGVFGSSWGSPNPVSGQG